MKRFTFLLGLVLLIACTQSQSSKPETESPVKRKTLAGGNSHEISADSATAAFSRWQNVKTQIGDTLCPSGRNQPRCLANSNARFLVNGFHIPIADLYQVLATVSDTSKIWATLATQIDPTTGKQFTTVIFQAKDAGTYRYFDFTKPCPSACPN